MAKILKHLVFGQKKNPPAPPQPDYEAKAAKNAKFADHHYANIGSFRNGKHSIHFEEKEVQENKLIVLQDYSDPSDLRAEIEALREEENDPLYMAPIDQAYPSNCGLENYEEVYCVPYEESDPPPLPSPCMNTVGSSYRADATRADSLNLNDDYDVVPDISHDSPEESGPAGAAFDAGQSRDVQDAVQQTSDSRPNQEYDEPWEWTVAGRLGESLQTSPSSPAIFSIENKQEVDHTYSDPAVSPQPAASCESLVSEPELLNCSEEMTTRQRRLYETAFDSRVKRDIDDMDGLIQSPVLQGDLYRPRISPADNGPVLRTVSRSSFGSTSGSSTSSTPTHQMISKPSPRPRHHPLHFTPTEKRKLTLIRDNIPVRSCSPLSRPIKVITDPLQKFNNRNNRADNRLISSLERQLSLNGRWDSSSRCSDKSSSSQESMDQKEDFVSNPRPRLFPLGKSASRDSIAYRDVVLPPRNLNDHVSEFSKFRTGSSSANHSHESLSPKEEHVSENFLSNKPVGGQSGVKVLPTDNGLFMVKNTAVSSPKKATTTSSNSVLNNTGESSSSAIDNGVRTKAVRPCNLLTNGCRPENVSLSTVQAQSPENDDRPSDDYDPPWEFKKRSGVNWSQSVPECLSRKAERSATEEVDKTAEPSNDVSESSNNGGPTLAPLPKLTKPGGPARPNLNLNLNLNSDSPRKARQSLSLNFGCAALSVVGEKVDAGLILEKQGWYHGSISRHDAENLLRVLKEGSYLVRNSESCKQDYSLSLRSARGFMHMKIVHSEGHFILGRFSNPFPSIPEMIHHYSINKLPIKGAEHMSLLYPVIDQLL